MRDIIEICDQLAAPFPIEEISWRVGPTNEKSRKQDEPLRGQALCYVDARTVMERFDSVVGVNGWACHYTPGVGTSIVCNIAIKFPVYNGENLVGFDWVSKADGAGPSDMEAEKGALSDAFKRAAVRWGVGRYLYDVKAPWLELDKRGNSAFIRPADHGRLAQLHEEFARRAGWGSHEGVAAYRVLLADIKQLTAQSAANFSAEHRALIEQMPVSMRQHLLREIQKKAEGTNGRKTD
ncbi:MULTISPECIES: Rad52/Rad22 family DNA repair protein [unclassified Bradyrhizobium]|uniref:Rad52/Rad22 family DNA repair protein n=1 Tax=unclassified Bradyrhizobium TaxID=2631580 RepID=UPI002FEE69CA